jgi:hypothetical protein
MVTSRVENDRRIFHLSDPPQHTVRMQTTKTAETERTMYFTDAEMRLSERMNTRQSKIFRTNG